MLEHEAHGTGLQRAPGIRRFMVHREKHNLDARVVFLQRLQRF
jgi:hypothetical protein